MTNKFNSYDEEGNEISHDYGDIFEMEQTKTSSRLKIGATRDQIELIMQLADKLTPPFFILYVLVASRKGHRFGRYQSPLIESIQELKTFLTHFKDYFETDGRHHIWIGTADNDGTIIYDQHNVIFAYGPVGVFRKELSEKGFKEQSFLFPSPHSHAFNQENDMYEDEIINYWDWTIYELADNDLYE